MPSVRLVSHDLGGALDARTDDELMDRVQRGDMQAFAALSRRHMTRLVRFCARLTGDAGAAEELSQETWLRIWRSRESYVGHGKFVPLLYTVARNQCRNHVRDRTRRGAVLTEAGDDLSEIAGVEPVAVSDLITRERQGRVQRAIQDLPEAMREAVILRFSEELSYEDMTPILETAETTIRSRVFHGLKRLRAALASEDLAT